MQDLYCAGFDDEAIFRGELGGNLVVKEGAGFGVVGDGMSGLDEIGGCGGGLGVHVINAITGEKNIIKMCGGEGRHLRRDGGVASDIEFDAAG